MASKNVFSKLFRSDDAAGEVKPSDAATPTAERPGKSKQTGAGSPGVALRRWQTEKAVAGEAMGQYTFIVPANTAKGMVSRAFLALTGVKPVRIAMGWVMPRRSQRGKVRKRLKKAVVTIAKGATVNVPSAEETKTAKIKREKAR